MNNTTEVTVILYRSPVKVLLSMLPCLVFLYVNGVMLFTLMKRSMLLESSRYILFAHLLLTDSMNLLMSMLLYILAVTMVRMMNNACIFVVWVASVAVKLSPLNLAVMSLERYVAICFPLRHADIATTRRTSVAIAIIWTVACLEPFIQLIVFLSLENTSFFMSRFCIRNTVLKLQIYVTIHMAITILIFVFVTVIIIYTYIAIIFAVKQQSASSDVQSSASKASNTVLLHMLQLCLCLLSTMFSMIHPSQLWNISHAVAIQLQYVLFLTLIIFPKCLSPLIYGLRDRAFGKIFKYYFTFGYRTAVRPHSKS